MEYPLEFYHFSYDWQIRDAMKRTVLKIDIEGQDFVQQNRTMEFCNRIVLVLNGMQEAAVEPKTVGDEVLEAAGMGSKPNGNGLLSGVQPRKRGRPRKA